MNELHERKYVYTPNTADWTITFREDPVEPPSALSPIDFGRQVGANAFSYAKQVTEQIQADLSRQYPDGFLTRSVAHGPSHLLVCFASLNAAASIYTIRHHPLIPDYVIASVEQGILIESVDHFEGCSAEGLAKMLRDMKSFTMVLERQYNFGDKFEISTAVFNSLSEAYEVYPHDCRDELDVPANRAESSAPDLIRFWRAALAP